MEGKAKGKRGRERQRGLGLPRETGVPGAGEKVSVKLPKGWWPPAFAKGCKSDKTPPLRTRPRRSVTWLRANRARGHFLVFVLRLRRLIANYIPRPNRQLEPSHRGDLTGIAVIFAGLKPDPSPHPADVGCLSWCIKVPRLDPTIFKAREGT